MFSYKMLSFASWLFAFSLGYFVGEILLKKYGREREGKFFKYARIILFVLSFCMFLWLMFNKELFHWNFDIATGEAVNHYSTYGKCVIYVILAMVSNVISYIISKRKA